MATLYITEYGGVGSGHASPAGIPVAQDPSVADQTVAISGSSTQSAAFNAATTFIRVHTDAICSITIGASPTATSAKRRMPADSTEYFGVVPGHKLAVISNT